MKTMIRLVFSVLTAALWLAPAHSDAATRSDRRQVKQQTRIVHGVQNGSLTHREARHLQRQQRHVRRVERRSKADGVYTAEERRRVERKQNQAHRNIRRKKNNSQNR